jgi:hypothetical protein
LADESLFRFKNGQVYQKEKKIRTRFLCKEIVTKKQFLFSPITEVELVKKEDR